MTIAFNNQLPKMKSKIDLVHVVTVAVLIFLTVWADCLWVG